MSIERKRRDFFRLLEKSEANKDESILRNNVPALMSQFEQIRDDLGDDEAKQVQERIKSLSDIISIKKRKADDKYLSKESIDSTAEMKKHAEIATDMIELTKTLKQNVATIHDQMEDDASVMNDAINLLHDVSSKSKQTEKSMSKRVEEDLGWRAYKWLFVCIAVFLLVRFLFQ